MSTPHRATEKQWASVIYWSAKDEGGSACILELRDRLTAAEQRISELQTARNTETDWQMERDGRLKATEERLAALEASTDAAFTQLAARVEAIEGLCALAEETANSKPTSNFSQIRSSTEGDSLVERVGAAIGKPGVPYPFWHDARAAIRAVAAWLRTETDITHGPRAAEWLEQEVQRHG